MKTSIREWHSRWCNPACFILLVAPWIISGTERGDMFVCVVSQLSALWMIIGYVTDANE